MTATSTSYLFFSGKGGVGKTSLASATAVRYAEKGRKTLIVTTDPASNLSDVFQQSLGHQISPIQGVENLWGMEIDADAATAQYRERILAPVREVFPPDMVQVMEEQLDSPCTEEMASFDQFVRLMQEPGFDVIVFDTAPTGHTLRLLELPADWSRHIEQAAQGSGQTCIGPVENLKESKERFDQAMDLLRDPQVTSFVFVLQPEGTSIRETGRSARELARLGINSQELVINGVLPEEECQHPFFRQRRAMQEEHLQEIARTFSLPQRQVPLLPDEIQGLDVVRQLAGLLEETGFVARAS